MYACKPISSNFDFFKSIFKLQIDLQLLIIWKLMYRVVVFSTLQFILCNDALHGVLKSTLY